MGDQLGSLVCFDETTRQPVDRNLDWEEVERGQHSDCGNPVAIDADFFRAYDIETQQRIWDDGVQWKFRAPADAGATDAFGLKRLPRPWAEGETLRMINRSNR